MADDEGTLLDKFFRRGETAPAATIFMLLGVLGGLHLGVWGNRMVREPWHLDASSPTVVAVGSECVPFEGGRFFIEVDQERFVCSGSDNKCGFEGPIDIAYDADDPAQCRAAKHVDGLSRYEQMLLIMGLGLAFIGLSGLSYVLSERARRLDLAADEPSRQASRARLRTACKVFMALAALAVNGAGLMIALGM